VVTDLAMPEMDGVELSRELRLSSETPIIVLSVRNQEESKIRALDAVADDYVTKPFSIQELEGGCAHSFAARTSPRLPRRWKRFPWEILTLMLLAGISPCMGRRCV
jgi:CheY-like chemotaxis protein